MTAYAQNSLQRTDLPGVDQILVGNGEDLPIVYLVLLVFFALQSQCFLFLKKLFLAPSFTLKFGI